MRRILSSGLALGALLAFSGSPVMAQDYQWSAGWSAGVLKTTSLNSGASGGESVDLEPGATWSVGFHIDRWMGSGRLGLRFRTSVSDQNVDWSQGVRSISIYGGDVGLMLRPVAPSPDRSVSFFVSAGVGLMRWGLGDGPTTSFTSAGASYLGDEGFQVTGVGGLGVDIKTPWSWDEGPLMIRLEGRDEVHRSPLDPLDAGGSDFGVVHNIRISVGLHTGVGFLPRR